MTTAQRIAATAKSNSYLDQQPALNEARDLAVKITAANCIQRTFIFHDGSTLSYDGGDLVVG